MHGKAQHISHEVSDTKHPINAVYNFNLFECSWFYGKNKYFSIPRLLQVFCLMYNHLGKSKSLQIILLLVDSQSKNIHRKINIT